MSDSAPAASVPPRLAGFDPARLRQSRAWDLLMRLPVLAYSTFLALVNVASLSRYTHEAGPALHAGAYAVNLAMRLSVAAYFVILAATVVIRTRPRGQARGAEPRISALLGTFLITAVVLFPRRELSLTAGVISTLLVLGGNALAVFVLVQLRRSFSIMAEARQLVTSGVYRVVRHPLYLAEEIAVIGVVMQFLSYWTLLLLAVQIAFQLRRMHNEEAVLAKTFPEYATYRQRTARIIPWVPADPLPDPTFKTKPGHAGARARSDSDP